MPVTTPQAMRHAEVSGTSLSNRDRLHLLHHRHLRERRRGGEVAGGHAADGEGLAAVAERLAAPRGLADGALVADAAVGDGGDDDVVARLHAGDQRADRFDHARALVAHQRRRRPRDGAVEQAHIAVADARGDEPHQHLIVIRCANLDVVADLGLLAHPHNAPHIPSLL